MKVAHSVAISVFVNEGEDVSKIEEKLAEIVPLDMEKEKVKIEHKTATGVRDNKIEIFDVRLEKERHVNAFLDDLFSKLSDEHKELLLRQIDSRLDDECHFFIRLDKEKLLDGEYWVTDSGNCYHIKILVAAYPAKKENAMPIVKKLLELH